MDVLRAGKRTISLNLKKPEAIEILKKLAKTSDVLVEPYVKFNNAAYESVLKFCFSYRPGKMEKLGIGPDVLLKENPRLIYARLTGFGSDGRGVYADRAGHDINYLAVSGLLSMFGRKGDEKSLSFLS